MSSNRDTALPPIVNVKKRHRRRKRLHLSHHHHLKVIVAGRPIEFVVVQKVQRAKIYQGLMYAAGIPLTPKILTTIVLITTLFAKVHNQNLKHRQGHQDLLIVAHFLHVRAGSVEKMCEGGITWSHFYNRWRANGTCCTWGSYSNPQLVFRQ